MRLYETNQLIYICTSDYTIKRNRRSTNGDYINLFPECSRDYIFFKWNNKNRISTVFKEKIHQGNFGKTVYFHPASKYPRFKLQGTSFKRTIKPDRADVIVIPTNFYISEYPRYELTRIYEDVYSKALYAIPEYLYKSWFTSEEEFLQLAKKWNTPHVELKYKETATLYKIDKKFAYVLDVVYGKYTKPIITDNMLDLEVSKSLNIITESDIDSIDSMLASKDDSIVELGLKTLCGFNVFKTPNVIKTLIFKNYNRIINNKALTTIAVRKLFNSIDFPRNNYILRSFPNWIDNLLDPEDNVSDFEATQIKRLLMPLFKNYIEQTLSKLTTASSKSYYPKLRYTIE